MEKDKWIKSESLNGFIEKVKEKKRESEGKL